MYKVKSYSKTCFGCPTSWDIFIHSIDDDRYWEERIYARYRWGWLSVILYDEEHPWDSGGKELLGKQIGDDLDSILGDDELIKHTRHILDWSTCNNESCDDENKDKDKLSDNDEWWNSLSNNMKTLIRKEYE